MKKRRINAFPEDIVIHHELKSPCPVKSVQLFTARISDRKVSIKPFSGESILIVLSGKITAAAGEKQFPAVGRRKSVFDGGASALFIPAGFPVSLVSENGAEIAIGVSRLAPKTRNLEPFIILPSQNRTRMAGSGRYRRRVTDILQAHHKADYLLAGETVSLPGMWSSYPPHKHDTLSPGRESVMEEIYFYRVEKQNRFGFQAIYDKRSFRAFMVHNNDALSIPSGYHPVSAPPDSRFYYLWVLCGKQRELLYSRDPLYD